LLRDGAAVFSPPRKATLPTPRGYLIIAVILVAVKVTQLATGHRGPRQSGVDVGHTNDQETFHTASAVCFA
jgi:hypothetical protein